MDYYAETNFFDHDGLVTSGGKGRDDYFEMLRRCGLGRISIPTLKTSTSISVPERLRLEIRLFRAWHKALSGLGKGDTIVLHHPPSEKFIGFTRVLQEVKKRGCRLIIIVFDLETYLTPYYRSAGRIKYMLSMRTETALFNIADVLIAHNDRMKDKIVSMGIDRDRIVSVGIMDYLKEDAPDEEAIAQRTGRDLPVVFCGNLVPDKAGFLDDVPAELEIDLYGPGYAPASDKTNIKYKGTVPSDRIIDVITGSFGLVWDGASSRSGAGVCGEYLRYNNPHKIAMYLASGMPVIVWDESAMAEFVRKEGCGFMISSLTEILGRIAELSDEEYEEMRRNAVRVGTGMRKGVHIRAAVEKALGMLDK